MVFADKRYNSHDKRGKLPGWITTHLQEQQLNLSTDMAVQIARAFMREMAQPYDRGVAGKQLLDQAACDALAKQAGFGRRARRCRAGGRDPRRRSVETTE